MRGFLQSAVRLVPSDAQNQFKGFARGRRSKLAKVANTTLIKADQWARGGSVTSDVGEALERAVAARATKKK